MLVREMFQKNRKIVAYMVGDDDSSSRAVVKHSYAAKQLLDPVNYVYPTGPNGLPLDDLGKLELTIPEPTFLADPTHRCKNFAKPIFKQSKRPKKYNKMGCHYADALRLKRYFGMAQKQHRNKTFGEFKRAMRACLEHLFDNHEFCGSWCKRASYLAGTLKEPPKESDSQTDDAKPPAIPTILEVSNSAA